MLAYAPYLELVMLLLYFNHSNLGFKTHIALHASYFTGDTTSEMLVSLLTSIHTKSYPVLTFGFVFRVVFFVVGMDMFAGVGICGG